MTVKFKSLDVLVELMAMRDLNAPMRADLDEWERMTPVVLECDIEIVEEDGEFVARCSNPEVASDGKTPEEALANLREALGLYFESADCGQVRTSPEAL